MEKRQKDKESSSAVAAGTLYLCATPIGNLEDITLRVLRVLKEVDLIAAEDTRDSKKLLTHFGIDRPLTSYHEFNKIEKAKWLAEELAGGKSIALITDAGTPGISDPGEDLVRICAERGIPVTALPGPAACITGLTLSGLAGRRFAFEAFLPEDKRKRRFVLEDLKGESRTIILYSAPHDIRRLLPELMENLGNRRIAVCRELTKRYEEILRTDLAGAIRHFEETDPRGEFVLVLEGKDPQTLRRETQEAWEEISIRDHVLGYEAQGLDRKEAMKRAAKDRGMGKRDVYRALLEEENGDR